MDWKLFHHSSKAAAEENSSPVVRSVHDELIDLKEQKCHGCTGYGHSSKRCPSTIKVDQIRKAGPRMKKLIDTLRAKVIAPKRPKRVSKTVLNLN